MIRSFNGRRVVSYWDILYRLKGDRRDAPRIEIERAGERYQVALRAGYDIRGPVEVWGRLAVQRPWTITTHPELEKRWPRRDYRGYIAELESKYPSGSSGREESRKNSIPTQR